MSTENIVINNQVGNNLINIKSEIEHFTNSHKKFIYDIKTEINYIDDNLFFYKLFTLLYAVSLFVIVGNISDGIIDKELTTVFLIALVPLLLYFINGNYVYLQKLNTLHDLKFGYLLKKINKYLNERKLPEYVEQTVQTVQTRQAIQTEQTEKSEVEVFTMQAMQAMQATELQPNDQTQQTQQAQQAQQADKFTKFLQIINETANENIVKNKGCNYSYMNTNALINMYIGEYNFNSENSIIPEFVGLIEQLIRLNADELLIDFFKTYYIIYYDLLI